MDKIVAMPQPVSFKVSNRRGFIELKLQIILRTLHPHLRNNN